MLRFLIQKFRMLAVTLER